MLKNKQNTINVSHKKKYNKTLLCDKTTLPEIIYQNALTDPDKVIFTDFKTNLTYTNTTLLKKIYTIANELENVSKTGDRIALLYTSGFDFIPAFLACLFSNRVAVPLFASQNKKYIESLKSIFNDCTPQAILTTTRYQEKYIVKYLDLLHFNHENICLTDTIQHKSTEHLIKPLTIQGIAFIQYTSGSTADPKGVMVSHENLIHNMSLIKEATDVKKDSRNVTWLPHYHDMGLITGLLQPLYSNVTH